MRKYLDLLWINAIKSHLPLDNHSKYFTEVMDDSRDPDNADSALRDRGATQRETIIHDRKILIFVLILQNTK